MDALAYLDTLPRFTDQGAAAYQPGLERMQALLATMGEPHQAYPSVHIAGTNGKGSTASFLAAIARAAGYRVGLHTSPHLWHVTERMRVDGQPAPMAWLTSTVARYHDLFEQVRPSFFEATVALSFLYFAEQQVELAVVEVGLGGRLDATNVLFPRLALITSIGLDHTELLGDTLVAIAREKAGIIKPRIPVLTSAVQPEVQAVVREVAAAQGSPYHLLWDEVGYEVVNELPITRLNVHTPLHRYEALEIGLPGRHQVANALLALRAAELTLPEVTQHPVAVFEGLRDVRRLSGLRGRFDVLCTSPLVVADVAHNPDGLEAVLTTFSQYAITGQRYALWGALRDKDAATMARQLVTAGFAVYVVALESTRAWPAEALIDFVQQAGGRILGVGTVSEGWQLVQQHLQPTDAVLITGSHQVVAGLPVNLWESKTAAAVCTPR
jgi:dihydrofolate synthase/folylpolyglutamate synthase